MSKKKINSQEEKNKKLIEQGAKIVDSFPLFIPIFEAVDIDFLEMEKEEWAYVESSGNIFLNSNKKAAPDEWAYIIAHCLLHLALNHPKKESMENQEYWNIACDVYITSFLAQLKFGKAPQPFANSIYENIKSEKSLYEKLLAEEFPDYLKGYSTMPGKRDMFYNGDLDYYWRSNVTYEQLFQEGLTNAVKAAVSVAGGHTANIAGEGRKTPAILAKEWFLSSYPLLGALASTFDIIEDPQICIREQVSIAAISMETKEIYINTAANLTDEEMKFVMAHELLHAGLSHSKRRRGRDPYLWNVACDFVINGWLIEMQIGDMPAIGGLYDPKLKGLSAESVYDRMVIDMRLYRKLRTFRGISSVDIIDRNEADFWDHSKGMDLDAFYRRALREGLTYHFSQDRGYLPEGLVEEIKSLSQPPIPWDVELSRWFDRLFQPIEKIRTYQRPSRRQGSTPNIARPRWINRSDEEDGRTFAVVIDTSGSMDRGLLGKALGIIASYAIARDVERVRVVYCDASYYDAGYLAPEALMDKVKVKGRGGTIVQPAISFLRNTEDFPKQGPILIITDGEIDRLSVPGTHAFVLPEGAKLPFIAKGEVFRMK